ncbi:hypothetical protein AJ78_00543 [Emergomyces pasteurianus Ep9510]|uniref:Sister chromatid cohesion protein Dcc1 n=1 Tax=Emergomyces pasteurianus Ep9510 TaxID=1447872 RepID=A0A1J9QH02_9EURO|nr:hypothetical protein AJ78_00543 [Emergomyces pasteurianus Ep9510]
MPKPAGRVLDFTHTSPQRAFKLVELPPELAEVVSSGKSGSILYLKAELSASSSSSDTYVNLCTTTHTYMIRQVHSSNSIYLIQPSPSTIQHQQQAKEEIPNCITTIAKCNATLELVKMDSNSYSAFPYLQRMLRVYSGTHAEEDGDVDMSGAGCGGMGLSTTAATTTTTTTTTTITGTTITITQRERRSAMKKLFAGVPLSPAECERSWVEICGFVHFEQRGFGGDEGEGGACRLACWRPSAVMRIQAWKRVLDGAVLQGIDMEKQFLVQDLWRATRDEEGDNGNGDAGFPMPLFDALVRRLMRDPASVGLGEVYEELKWASFDKGTTVSWIGEAYLEANAPDPSMAIGRVEFLESWKDLLPESWRSEAAWDNLKTFL